MWAPTSFSSMEVLSAPPSSSIELPVPPSMKAMMPNSPEALASRALSPSFRARSRASFVYLPRRCDINLEVYGTFSIQNPEAKLRVILRQWRIELRRQVFGDFRKGHRLPLGSEAT